MSTLTCPIRFKLALIATATLLLAACASTPNSANSQKTANSDTSGKPAIVNEEAPSIIIKGKTAAAILDSVVKFRTQKGMKLLTREARRVELVMPVPKSTPPAEAHMIFSLSPASEGLRLSAQVFQIIRQGDKTQTSDITTSLTSKLNDELAMYAR